MTVENIRTDEVMFGLWLNNKKRGSPRTREAYNLWWRRFTLWMRSRGLDGIRSVDIPEMNVYGAQKLCHTDIRACRSFFTWCMHAGYLKNGNPAHTELAEPDKPTAVMQRRKAIGEKAIRKLLYQDFANPRDKFAIWCAYFAALRYNELRWLRFEDIYVDERKAGDACFRLHVRHAKGGRKKEREFPIPQKLYECYLEMKDYIEPQDEEELIFAYHKDPSRPARCLRDKWMTPYMTAEKIGTVKDLRPHDLRRAHVTIVEGRCNDTVTRVTTGHTSLAAFDRYKGMTPDISSALFADVEESVDRRGPRERYRAGVWSKQRIDKTPMRHVLDDKLGPVMTGDKLRSKRRAATESGQSFEDARASLRTHLRLVK